jgi:hypothetical protein
MKALSRIKKDSLEKYLKDLRFHLKEGHIEKTDWEYIREYLEDYWMETYDPKNFKFYGDRLEIIMETGLPRIYQPYFPPDVFVMPLKSFREYLRPEYRNE